MHNQFHVAITQYCIASLLNLYWACEKCLTTLKALRQGDANTINIFRRGGFSHEMKRPLQQ